MREWEGAGAGAGDRKEERGVTNLGMGRRRR